MRLVLALVASLQLVVAADTRVTHVRNFADVNPHLYRGGEPSLAGLSELSALGIKLIIDLREPGAGTVAEQRKAETLGIHYANVPLPRLSAPAQGDIERVLSLLVQNESQPVFIHCWRGKDRTGTVIACYRIQHDGWTNQQALAEAKRFGLSRLESSMRAFIARFQALAPPAGANLGN